MAQFEVVVFALLELLAAQFVARQSAPVAVLAAQFATHLQGQAFLSLLPPLHPLSLCLCL